MIATRKQEAYLFPLLFYGLITEVVIMKKANGGFVNNEDDIRRIVEERTPGYEYAGGYTGSEGSLRIRCKTCGTEVVRSIISIRHNHLRCRECDRLQRERQKQERRAEILRRQRERDEQWRLARIDRTAKQVAFKVCPVCNGLFIPTNKKQKYCGEKCIHKKFDNKDKRVRKLRALTKDRDISLEGLFRRDKGICYLCGGQCDWNDIETREDGTKIAGDWYPSIDHVRPLSKGGLHAWDNVRLAHRICNTRKCDKEDILPIAAT